MNQNGGSRTETLVKLVLIFVISLLSFSVGTFVGKQFSDSQHKMASLEKEFNTGRDVASAGEAAQTVKKDEALTDEDIASLTQEFIDAEKNPAPAPAAEMPAVAMQEKPEAKVEKAAMKETSPMPEKADSVAEAAQRIANDMSPSPNPAPKERIPSSLPRIVSGSSIGKYTVQISSYQLEGDAQSHAKKLIDKGFNAFYVEADIKGKKWYRVSVGLFGTKSSAEQYKKSLIEQAAVTSAIVQKIVK